MQVNDLSKNGLTDEEITREVFLKNLDDKADDIEGAIESAVRKVRRYRKKADLFIKRGQIS